MNLLRRNLRKMLDLFSFCLYILTFYWGPAFSKCLSTPTFVSDWFPIESQSSALSEVVITHGLNAVPAKVLAEVKVFNGSSYNIFPAFGSAHVDDNHAEFYGGIVYIYSNQEVRLFAPNVNNGTGHGRAIYTGSANSWKGPANIAREYMTAEVRVRLWKYGDLIGQSFSSGQINISTLYENETFYEIPHGLDVYPDLVNVRLRMQNGYYSDASGSTSNVDYCDGSNAMGGVLFGYNETHIRIWAPLNNETCPNVGVISLTGGWGNNTFGLIKSTHFVAIAWIFPSAARLQSYTLNSTNMDTFLVPIELDGVLINETLINVEVEATSESNENFRFPAVGSVSNDGTSSAFGGLVYGYNDVEVALWIANGISGYILNIQWGNIELRQSSNDVNIIITVWELKTEENVRCWLSSSKTSYSIVEELHYLDRLKTSCGKEYVLATGSQSYLECKRDCSILHPICIEKDCSSLGSVANADTIRSGTSYGDITEYECHYGYALSAGSLIRQCKLGPQWSGSEPICSAITCPLEETDISNAEKTITNNLLDGVVNYTCSTGYQYVFGSLSRTCQSNGTWSGIDIYCEGISCPVDNLIPTNTILTRVTGIHVNDVIVYVCRENYNLVEGNLYRVCQMNGSWGNHTPVCQETAKNTSTPTSVTAEKIAALKISVKNTSNYRRSLISVYESRPSAIAMGTVGTVIIAVFTALIFLPDLPKIWTDIRTHWNIDLLKHLCRRQRN